MSVFKGLGSFPTTTLWGSIKLAMLTFKLIKNGGVGVLSTMSSIHKCFFHYYRIWTTRVKENNEKEQKKPKKWATLDLSSHFGSPNHELSLKLFFWFGPIGFPSKMMPCRLNQNLICLGPRSLCKVLGTNLKLLTNRNAWFHWAPVLGPLFKVALRICGGTTKCPKQV
jgi:hypothetical protein